MDFLNELLANLLSAGAVAVAIAFLALSLLTGYMDRKLEEFRHAQAVDAQTRGLILKSEIEFKERQLAEFYGLIYARLQRGKRLYELLCEGKLDRVSGAVAVS